MTQKEDAQQKAVIERERFNSFARTNTHITAYRFTKQQYSRYDLKMCSGNTYFLGEIKNRQYSAAFFKSNKPYIEMQKLASMVCEQKTILERKKVNVNLLYLNFTVDGFVQIYSLKGVNSYTWALKELPVDDFTPNVLVWKLVAELTEEPIETVKLNLEKTNPVLFQ